MMCLGQKMQLGLVDRRLWEVVKKLEAFPFNDIFTWASFATIRFLNDKKMYPKVSFFPTDIS